MDNDSTRNSGPLSFADMLSPLERIREGMPQADLSLFEVGKLTFPDNARLQQWLVGTLISQAKADNLPVYGNPHGWSFNKSNDRYWNYGDKDPFPKVEGHKVPPCGPVGYSLDAKPSITYLKSYSGGACLVSHANYFAFLKIPAAVALGIPAPNWPEPARPATPESIPSVETSLSEKRQRIDGISNAIRAALAVLSPSGALPRPHELFEHLAHNDATKTITGIAKGNRGLLWIDDNGNEQHLTFSALGKRLDRIRQGN